METSLIDFEKVAKRVFHEAGGKIYIGGEEVKKEMRDLLREQAKYIQTSQFWEILHSTVINESAHLALMQSKEWEHVLTAKMLKHWAHVFENMMHTLSKE